MQVTVKCFALARQLAGREAIEVELAEAANVADLKAAITSQYPELSQVVSSSMIAVNGDYVVDSFSLNASQEIACIPPVSGG